MSAYNRLNLGLIQIRLDRPAEARLEIEAARPMLTEAGDTSAFSITYSYMGLALEADRQAGQAAASYETAVKKLKQLGASGYAVDGLAGQARCALVQNDLPLAKRLASEVWDYLRQSGASGLEFPLLAFESCARIFEATADEAALRAAVEAGHRELMQRAARISDPEWRQSFLQNVPEHHDLLIRWERLAA